MLNALGTLAWNQREYRTLLLIRAHLEAGGPGGQQVQRLTTP